MSKTERILWIFRLMFLTLAVMHIFLLFSSTPHFSIPKIGYCWGDDELIGYVPEKIVSFPCENSICYIKAFPSEETAKEGQCIPLYNLNYELETYSQNIKRNGFITNIIAVISYLISFAITFIPERKSINQ